jgi:hypothetical protein
VQKKNLLTAPARLLDRQHCQLPAYHFLAFRTGNMAGLTPIEFTRIAGNGKQKNQFP